MRLFLDTSVAVAIRNTEGTLERIRSASEPPLISVLTVAELESGIARVVGDETRRAAALINLIEFAEVVPLTLTDARAYGVIVRELGFVRSKIVDRLIAAQALNYDAVLATLNARDFIEIRGLRVDDWSREPP